jgi:hypothetical protein
MTKWLDAARWGNERGFSPYVIGLVGVMVLALASCSVEDQDSQPETIETETAQTASAVSHGRAQIASDAWLSELNHFRAVAGLQPVMADPELNRDCFAHAKYLIDQGPEGADEFIDYTEALGLRVHQEDPSSSYYTEAGAGCSQGVKLAPGYTQSNQIAWGHDSMEDLDGLFYDAPFHRLGLLASWATYAGYGDYGQWPRRAGVLALKGKRGGASPLIKFPGEDSTVGIGKITTLELPDPLSSCPGYQMPVGLPITVQFGSTDRGRLTSYEVIGSSGPVETCAFDWSSYQNPSPEVRESGRKTLSRYGAVILVPRYGLSDDRYTVTVNTTTQKLEWSFRVASATESAMNNR